MSFHTVTHKECIRVETAVGDMSHWSTEASSGHTPHQIREEDKSCHDMECM